MTAATTCMLLGLVSAVFLLNVGQAFIVASKQPNKKTFQRPLFATRPLTVALTREQGKNEKLRTELETALGEDHSLVQLEELPCVAHAEGEDFDRLATTLNDSDWDYVVVTSPEAARVLAKAWKGDSAMATTTTTSMVAVGKATQATLEKLGIVVNFCPTKATAATLVKELPIKAKGDTNTVLYPASAKAASTLEDGLADRGFAVTRLNTYDTVTATWDMTQRMVAQRAGMACFGSPSAVKGWLTNTDNNRNVMAVCIGETSAMACRKNEWPEDRIFFPEKPGISGWAAAAKEALEAIQVAHT